MARSSAQAFVAYRAAFEPGKTGRGRSVKYFLVEADGRETLAAYADESTPGDSHYTYKNCEEFTSFGTLCCHNRKALHSWCEWTEARLISRMQNTSAMDLSLIHI